MTTLSKIFLEFAELMGKIEENCGEVTDEILTVLQQSELQVQEKIDNYIYLNDAVKSQIDNTKKLIDDFKKRLKSLENLETRLKDNVKHVMSHHDLIEIKGSERTIKLVNPGGTCPTHKPEDMFSTIETVNPDYFIELMDYLEPKIVYVISDKEKFKQAVKENKFKSIYLMPKSKTVKFN